MKKPNLRKYKNELKAAALSYLFTAFLSGQIHALQWALEWKICFLAVGMVFSWWLTNGE